MHISYIPSFVLLLFIFALWFHYDNPNNPC